MTLKFKINVSLLNVHEKCRGVGVFQSLLYMKKKNASVSLKESGVGVGASCLNQERHHEGATIGFYGQLF